MPDITKATVSASQMPALFNLSPYATRWMMHHHFAHNMPLEADENDRMTWGTRLERVIMNAAADELRAEVLSHDQGDYLRHPELPIGCTPDGYTFDPQLGLGFVEAKNIDWLRWRDTWSKDRAADHVEIQHQQQLMIPHPVHGLPKWGCIAALVGGNELLLYKRAPLPAVQEQIKTEAIQFLTDVKIDLEPEVFGAPIEVPALALAYPKIDPLKTITEADLDPKHAIEVARMIDDFMLQADRASATDKEVKSLKAKLLAVLGDASGIIVHGRMLEVTKSAVAGSTRVVKPYVMTRFNPRLLNLAADLDALEPPAAEVIDLDIHRFN